ncbi:unnamed protein product, partial [Amoebophrya sp. A25]
ETLNIGPPDDDFFLRKEKQTPDLVAKWLYRHGVEAEDLNLWPPLQTAEDSAALRGELAEKAKSGGAVNSSLFDRVLSAHNETELRLDHVWRDPFAGHNNNAGGIKNRNPNTNTSSGDNILPTWLGGGLLNAVFGGDGQENKELGTGVASAFALARNEQQEEKGGETKDGSLAPDITPAQHISLSDPYCPPEVRQVLRPRRDWSFLLPDDIRQVLRLRGLPNYPGP